MTPSATARSLPDDPRDCIAKVATQGDRQAFTRLFASFAPKLKRYFLRSGFAAEEAEDLSQDVMLLVWRRAALFDPAKADAWGWIYAIARNVRIDRFRKAARAPAAWPDPLDVASEPHAEMERTDDARRLTRALRDLPEGQNAVVRLAYYADEPHAEIARRLNLPLGTVKSRLRRAAARLRSSLGE